jgi:hypothetical protein
LKRKREREEVPQLAIDAPPPNGQLAIDYNYDHASTTVKLRIFFLLIDQE